MDYSSLIACQWIAVCEQDDIKYTYEEEAKSLKIVWTLGNKLEEFTLKVICKESDCYINGVIQEKANISSPKNMADVTELLTRINYSWGYGSLQMDYSDGEILYFYPIDVEGGFLSEQVIRNAMAFACRIMEKYGDAIYNVIHGLSSPKGAMEEVDR